MGYVRVFEDCTSMSQFAASSMEWATGAGTPVRLWKSATLSSLLIVVALIVIRSFERASSAWAKSKYWLCMAVRRPVSPDAGIDKDRKRLLFAKEGGRRHGGMGDIAMQEDADDDRDSVYFRMKLYSAFLLG